jgi:hypothetical protein
MFMHQYDFELTPMYIDDPEDPSKKAPMLVHDINILRKMYRLKNLYENQKIPTTYHNL